MLKDTYVDDIAGDKDSVMLTALVKISADNTLPERAKVLASAHTNALEAKRINALPTTSYVLVKTLDGRR